MARQHDGQLQRSGQQVGPLGQRSHRLRRRRRGHRRPIRLQGHRPADDQPVLRGVDRPRRLRAAHDDRIDHHVPVHGRVRLRTLLRRPILRPLPTGRRLGLRRHVRLGHDRRPFHRRERADESPGHRLGFHLIRMSSGAAVRRIALRIRW